MYVLGAGPALPPAQEGSNPAMLHLASLCLSALMTRDEIDLSHLDNMASAANAF